MMMSDNGIRDQLGLFPPLSPTVWFCGAAMGGYGSYDNLDHSVGVLNLVVPVDMIAGHNFKDMDKREWRQRLVELLMDGVER